MEKKSNLIAHQHRNRHCHQHHKNGGCDCFWKTCGAASTAIKMCCSHRRLLLLRRLVSGAEATSSKRWCRWHLNFRNCSAEAASARDKRRQRTSKEIDLAAGVETNADWQNCNAMVRRYRKNFHLRQHSVEAREAVMAFVGGTDAGRSLHPASFPTPKST